ncbi:hypothetical protein [Bacillus sp. SJS]|uniref:hypothetical protein n=1 Tax=Bacillus sp. SJS TaxID=1423321 RepID=UPI0004DD0AE8|nr:hypothetical protein [Bacillus sp. SJS]KZZ84368.1 hypothetical protein AS29_010930 [Bacillus sp. SJS]
MNRMKPIYAGLLIALLTVVMSGCMNEGDLKRPLDQYLKESYGIKSEDYHFLTWDNNWFEGIEHQTAIEIEKPYVTTVYISMERDTYKVESERVYPELVKGAFINQHPEVLTLSEKMIDQYGFLKKSPTGYHEMKDNFYYYLNVNVGENIKNKLAEDFKKTQKIQTEQLLPAYMKSSENTDEEPDSIRVNFAFYYNTQNRSDAIPSAENLVKDYEKGGVLPQGLYSIGVKTINSSDGGYSVGVDSRNSTVMFRVDSNGAFQDVRVLLPEI